MLDRHRTTQSLRDCNLRRLKHRCVASQPKLCCINFPVTSSLNVQRWIGVASFTRLETVNAFTNVLLPCYRPLNGIISQRWISVAFLARSETASALTRAPRRCFKHHIDSRPSTAVFNDESLLHQRSDRPLTSTENYLTTLDQRRILRSLRDCDLALTKAPRHSDVDSRLLL
jgi:hypothetical protein